MEKSERAVFLKGLSPTIEADYGAYRVNCWAIGAEILPPLIVVEMAERYNLSEEKKKELEALAAETRKEGSKSAAEKRALKLCAALQKGMREKGTRLPSEPALRLRALLELRVQKTRETIEAALKLLSLKLEPPEGILSILLTARERLYESVSGSELEATVSELCGTGAFWSSLLIGGRGGLDTLIQGLREKLSLPRAD